MALHPLAGQPAPFDLLPNLPRLVSAYYTAQPDPQVATQAVSFGTSGHRGTSTENSFNAAHSRHLPGDQRVAACAGHYGATLPGDGHPCALRSGALDGD